ncbi:unnamed protein product [Leptidea sinapis]|uniref:Endonuclease/exonuclease/phosphatase domain-containing protein n=1 Tax=Leptidea sinapis TaxID=189913 RepID=A0A5E4PVM9_9NEOP|nr:unnamed protein product [Leptidea sinapis]
MGDLNAHPGARFGNQLNKFCEEMLWEWTDYSKLGNNSDIYTFQCFATGSRRWLDHCITTKAAWDTVVGAYVTHDVRSSDHHPLSIECNISGLTLSSATSCGPDSLKIEVMWVHQNQASIVIGIDMSVINTSLIDFIWEARRKQSIPRKRKSVKINPKFSHHFNISFVHVHLVTVCHDF